MISGALIGWGSDHFDAAKKRAGHQNKTAPGHGVHAATSPTCGRGMTGSQRSGLFRYL